MTDKRDIKLTDSQKRIISSDKKKMLVSASAGTGKTFVMVERITNLILSGKANVDKILVVTFAKASAEEMRERIERKLYDSLDENPALKTEIKKLATASISTLHSFCADLIRQYFYAASVAPKFSIIEESKSVLLKRKVANDLLDTLYELDDEDFLALVDIFSISRRDEGLVNAIIELYNFSRALEDPTEYLKTESIKNYEHLEVFENILRKQRIEKLETMLARLNDISRELLSQNMTIDLLSSDEIISGIEIALNAKSDEEVFFALEQIDFKVKGTFMKAKSSEEETALHKTFLAEKGDIKKALAKILEDRELLKNKDSLPLLARRMKKLAELTFTFSMKYAFEKKKKDVLDFSDLEHFARNILENDDIASEVCSRFSYVFIDEYQDTSRIQESIIRRIAKNNLFMVGDIKQSIFSFRQCDKEIFAEKEREYSSNELGEIHYLKTNHRSGGNILNFVNHLFAPVMTQSAGDDYLSNSMFDINDDLGDIELSLAVASSKKKEQAQKIYSVLSDNEKSDAFHLGEIEGKMIAEKIRKIVGIKEYKGKTLTYSDTAILLRAHTSEHAENILKTLIEEGIPASLTGGNSYLMDYGEVKVAYNFLMILKNHKEDIPLISVLRSGFFNFSDSDLLEIRKSSLSKKYFFESFELARESEKYSEKIDEFFRALDRYRTLAMSLGGVYALKEAMEERGMTNMLLRSMYGEEKLKRLNEFLAVADSLDEDKNLYSLLASLERLQKDIKLVGGVSLSDRVQIMSIHKSKGLEFPVVFLAGTAKKFNDGIKSAKLLYHPNLGLATKSYDLSARTRKNNIAESAILATLIEESRFEELRILYVGLTRAKHKLFITGSMKSNDLISSLDDLSADPISGTRDLLSRTSYLDWILGIIKNRPYQKLNVSIKSDFESGLANAQADIPTEIFSPDQTAVEAIVQNLAYSYPKASSTNLPTKFSASSLKKDFRLEEEVSYRVTEYTAENASTLGTAYHALIENLQPFSSMEDISKTLAQLIDYEIIDEESATHIDLEKIYSALNQDLYNFGKAYKEKPFMLYERACDILPTDSTDRTLIQGVIDLLLVNEKDKKALVVDYKLTRIESETKIAELYKNQLDIYAHAVNKILNLDVVGKYIFDIAHGKLIKVD